MSLVELTPDVLGQILSFNGLAHVPLLFFCIGNRALRSKLCQGVTHLELTNRLCLSLVRLPLFLTELRSLRSLTIDRGGNALVDMPYTAWLINNLSPTLRVLRLRFENASKLLITEALELAPPAQLLAESESHGSHLPPSPRYLERLVQLEVLELGNHSPISISDAERLPASLTELDFSMMALDEEEWIRWAQLLPRSLNKLTIYESPYASFYRLIPHISRVYARDCIDIQSEDLINGVPSSHADFSRPVVWAQWTDQQALICPPNVTDLSVRNLGSLNFPPNLKSLKYSNSSIMSLKPDDFPRGLTSLISSLTYVHYTYVFPRRLTHLFLAECDISHSSLSSLFPLTLLSLQLRLVVPSAVSHLPSKLTFLQMTVDGRLESISAFPPALKRLIINGEHCAEALKTPLSPLIEDLLLDRAYTSTLLLLPPALNTIFIGRLVHAHDISLNGPNTVLSKRIDLLRKYAPNQKEDFGFAGASYYSRMTPFDLFPRTLKSITLPSYEVVSAPQLARLPKGLTQLTLGNVPESALLHIPGQQLVNLSIRLPCIRDGQIKALPKTLEVLHVGSPTTIISANLDLIKEVPIQLRPTCFPTGSFRDAYTALFGKRIVALQNFDRAALTKLLSLSPQ